MKDDKPDGGLPPSSAAKRMMFQRDEHESFMAAVGKITHLTQHPAILGSVRVPPKFRTADEQASDKAKRRERQRQVIRDWLKDTSAYSQMPSGCSVESDSPIEEVLVDGYVDFEKLLDRLDGVK